MHPHSVQIENALSQRQTPLQLFLRDDDVDEDEDSLRALLTLCARMATPLNLAVIPGRLTDDAMHLLKHVLREHPDLFELHQHGWLHLNHEATGKKCEFGASRNFDEQRADLNAGQTRLNEAFGDNWFPVFVPPWNRCTASTVQALVELRFRALSRDASQPSFAHSHLPELPVTLDLFRWRGGAMLRPVEELTVELSQQISRADRMGIMLHHKVMNERAFGLLNEWLRIFKQFPLVQFHTLRSLLPSP